MRYSEIPNEGMSLEEALLSGAFRSFICRYLRFLQELPCEEEGLRLQTGLDLLRQLPLRPANYHFGKLLDRRMHDPYRPMLPDGTEIAYSPTLRRHILRKTDTKIVDGSRASTPVYFTPELKCPAKAITARGELSPLELLRQATLYSAHDRGLI